MRYLFVARYIIKFGGTSVGNTNRIQHAAGIVAELVNVGHEITVVVSAMAGMTNQLVAYANALSAEYTPEHDVITTSGEQITAGLMALALEKRGLKAQSFLAWQIAIKTDANHGNAKITNISTDQLEDCFGHGIIPVVAGFQGLTTNNRITTLGRGGSDTTAVALAAALNADSCYIYTDVEGVYTADPRIIPNARKIDVIRYPAMLALATHGAKVLHAHCVELGMQHGIDLHVRSSFVPATGTRIAAGESTRKIDGIAHSLNETYINISGTSEQLRHAHSTLVAANIIIDMDMDPTPEALHFTINKADLEHAKSLLTELKLTQDLDILAIDPNIVKISIVGVGIMHDLTIEPLVRDALAAHQINVQLALRSDIKLSLVIAHDQMTKAMGVLHNLLIVDDLNKPLN
jgi:aspartate kinase